MTELVTTYCDKCNPKRLSAMSMGGRGVVDMPFARAKVVGFWPWKERDGQHICPYCLEEESIKRRMPDAT